jgi:RND family efflux transporter MFP subunit
MKNTTMFIAAAALMASGCAAPAPPPVSMAAPMPVAIGRAAITDVAESFEAGGVVRARLTAMIASRVMAPVTTVHVRPGDRVRQGAPLVTLDARELTANAARAAAALMEAIESVRASESDVRAADAGLRLARAGYDRVKTLHDSRSATPQELDDATSALAGAEAHLSSAQARASAAAAARTAADAARHAADVSASYAVLSAPFDGSVTERFVDPGTLASPGTPLVVIEDPSALRLEVQLDEARAGGVFVGEPIEASIDTTPDPGWCRARLAEIGRLNAASHSFLIKIDLPSGARVRTGAFGRARFSGPVRRAVTVPETSLIRRGQLTLAFFVTTDGVARLRAIVPGTTANGRTEVLAGLADGDRVVSTPAPSLTDGARVTEQRR